MATDDPTPADRADAETAAVPRTPEELSALLARAEGGDESTLAVLRVLVQIPAVLNDVMGGDLPRVVRRNLIAVAAADNLAFREGLTAAADNLRDELAGPDPSPAVRLLAERVTTDWLSLHLAEARHARIAKDIEPAQDVPHQARLSREHARYLAGLRTLERVRRLTGAAPGRGRPRPVAADGANGCHVNGNGNGKVAPADLPDVLRRRAEAVASP